MKNCLICQTGQDQVSLTRVPVNLEGAPWGDILVCRNCFEVLGAEEVKHLIRIAVQEKSFEPGNVLLAGEKEGKDAPLEPGMVEVPVSAALLRDPQAFSRSVGEKMGAKLWELHRRGVSEAVWSTSLTPDGEGGYVFAAAFAPAPAAGA
ncbi:MAG TPA: hypothetical protein VJ385_22760 [Fibrobacteria bacterium]|nr:hypothetical protein [Fibrobacteria bacterium]